MDTPKPFYHRNLPHWHPPGRSIFLTWRLEGSLPRKVIEKLRITRQQLSQHKPLSKGWTNDRRVLEYKILFAKVDAILDKAETGPVWLKEVAIANLIQETLLERYAYLYRLQAYVVMANHLHVFLNPEKESTIASITKNIKGYTAREANKLLGRTGKTFWQDESFDHWARDRAEFFRIVKYIERNPVKARLVEKPEDWRWSSAAERRRRGLTEFQALT
jgi:REP-associated tyrosine transposase